MSVFKGNQVCVQFFKINIQQQAIVPKNLKLISIGKMAHAKKQIRNNFAPLEKYSLILSLK
jgi:hypothetical protein